VTLQYGFMEHPDVPAALERLRVEDGLPIDPDDTTFFLGRETVLSTERPGMARWRERLFAFMSSNASRATAFFRVPPEQVVEIGMHIEI